MAWLLGVGTQENSQGCSQVTETLMCSTKGSEPHFPEITWLYVHLRAGTPTRNPSPYLSLPPDPAPSDRELPNHASSDCCALSSRIWLLFSFFCWYLSPSNKCTLPCAAPLFTQPQDSQILVLFNLLSPWRLAQSLSRPQALRRC